MTIDISSTLFEVLFRKYISGAGISVRWVLIFASVDIFDNWCVCHFWSLPVSSVALDQENQSLLFQCYVYDWRCFLEYLEIFFL